MKFTKLDYCQYLLSSQVNYTLTNLAEHLDQFSHDTINRYLKGEKLSPRLLFEQVEPMLEQDPEAYLIFDDTVLEKSFGPEIEVARKQWSGNEKRVIQGIGVVSCVYVNPQTEKFWVIDYRIFDPLSDGKSKLPGSGAFWPHGVDRHQRSISGLDPRRSKGARREMEN